MQVATIIYGTQFACIGWQILYHWVTRGEPPQVSILYIASIVYVSILIFQFIPPLPVWYPYICSLCLCLFLLWNDIVLSHFSRVWLSATLRTMACQAPLSVGFSRQEYWSGLPFPLLHGVLMHVCLCELPKNFTLFVKVLGIWMDSGGLKTRLSAGSRWIKGEGHPQGKSPRPGLREGKRLAWSPPQHSGWNSGLCACGPRLCVILVSLFVLVCIFQNFYSDQESAQQPDKNSIKKIFSSYFFSTLFFNWRILA